MYMLWSMVRDFAKNFSVNDLSRRCRDVRADREPIVSRCREGPSVCKKSKRGKLTAELGLSTQCPSSS